MTDLSLYRPCVGIALFNNKGQVFAGERIDTPGAWQMPQGGIDPGEDIETAAFRELYEEVGTRKAVLKHILPEPLLYDLPDDLRQRLWGGRYHGQAQTWVTMQFTGSDADIDIHHFDPPEFANWQWIDLKDLLDLIVPFKRDVYAQIIDKVSDIM